MESSRCLGLKWDMIRTGCGVSDTVDDEAEGADRGCWSGLASG